MTCVTCNDPDNCWFDDDLFGNTCHTCSNNWLEFTEINLEYAGRAKFLHLTSFVGEKPFEAQKKLVKTLSDVKVSFDPGALYART